MSHIYDNVKNYYGNKLKTNKDLQTNACTSCGILPEHIREIITLIPDAVLEKYYGCGLTIPVGGIEGLTVLDLGCGAGRDCYVLSKMVGKDGNVFGIDMTESMLHVAVKNRAEYVKKIGYDNMFFLKGYIEDIQATKIKNGTIDLVVSNCVLNLSPDKLKVLSGVYDCLKEGGEFYFSDVYSDRRIPEEIRQHKELWGECVSGALYIEDFIRYCHKVGFQDPRIIEKRAFKIHNEELRDIVKDITFYSITFRLFKLKDLETKCEEYNQVAIYNGGIKEQHLFYTLDDHHCFSKNKKIKVCGNTADMLEKSWLSRYFTVIGDKSKHYGLFDCQKNSETTILSKNGGCC